MGVFGPVYGVGMIAMAVIFVIVAPSGGQYAQRHPDNFVKNHLLPLKESMVWRFGLYYYFVFGSFLALLLWLDRGSLRWQCGQLGYVLGLYGVPFLLSYPPTTMTIHGVSKDVHLVLEVNVWMFTFLMIVIGVAQGFGRASVYKTIYKYYPDNMGSVGAQLPRSARWVVAHYPCCLYGIIYLF